MLKFKDFLQNIILENLHPEIKSIIEGPHSVRNKHKLVVAKIKDLTNKGQKTGIEGNMPKGSSRAYLAHEEPHQAVIDGKKTSFKIGTKIAIKAPLDIHHNHDAHDGLSLGQLQNDVENNDYFLNSQYRVLHKQDDGSYETNHDHGIFPPLVDHDDKTSHWATVGHSRDLKPNEFNQLTKTATHPRGITHKDFVSALVRDYDKEHGRYWERQKQHEDHLDHVASHPLVEKFLNHQRNYGATPHDYRQKKNMGVFEHPNGQKFIVARDHGFDHNVNEAYGAAIKKKYNR